MTIDLTHLRRLLAEASPRPWRYQAYVGDPGRSKEYALICNERRAMLSGEGFFFIEKDAALVSAAVNALPELIEEVERLRTIAEPALRWHRFIVKGDPLEGDFVAKDAAEVELDEALAAYDTATKEEDRG